MKILTKVLIVLGTPAVAILIIGGLYIYRFNYEIGKMHAVDTRELTKGIWSIKDDTYINMYLVKIGSKYVAIDAAKSIKSIKSEMEKMNIRPDDVIAILLTHTDSDHVGAIKLFKNAKVYISSEEEQMINGKTARTIVMRNKLDITYEIITNNQVRYILGLKIRGVLTPGHTPGSMTYILNDRYLFSGDALSLKDQMVKMPSKFFSMDSTKAAKSIGKLVDIANVAYIFTAHYGYTDNYQQAFDYWKEESGAAILGG